MTRALVRQSQRAVTHESVTLVRAPSGAVVPLTQRYPSVTEQVDGVAYWMEQAMGGRLISLNQAIEEASILHVAGERERDPVSEEMGQLFGGAPQRATTPQWELIDGEYEEVSMLEPGLTDQDLLTIERLHAIGREDVIAATFGEEYAWT